MQITQNSEFHQKTFGTKTFFVFTDETLRHRVKDQSGELDFSVEYSDIPINTRIVFKTNTWVRNVGVLWVIIGLVQIGLAVTGSSPVRGSAFWLLMGLGCLAFYWFTRSTFTVIDTDAGSIWILHDKNYKTISDSLQSRRRARLLSWYQSMDYGDDTETRIRALNWLVKQEALSRADADVQIAAIRIPEKLLITPHSSADRPLLH